MHCIGTYEAKNGISSRRSSGVGVREVFGPTMFQTASISKCLWWIGQPTILSYMKPFAEDEEIVYGFDEESPFAFPAIDPCSQETNGLDSTPQSRRTQRQRRHQDPPRRQRPALRGATPSGGAAKIAKAKAKNPTIASLAQEIGSMLEALPKISAD